MSTILQKILSKSASIQLGLVRMEQPDDADNNKAKRVLLPARTGFDESRLHCVVKNDEVATERCSDTVSLIQRDKANYIYITGVVREKENADNISVLSIEVTRAFWFIRCAKGSVTWLKEKYLYELEPEVVEIAC